jgi:hypothetical protein
MAFGVLFRGGGAGGQFSWSKPCDATERILARLLLQVFAMGASNVLGRCAKTVPPLWFAPGKAGFKGRAALMYGCKALGRIAFAGCSY